MFFSSAFCQLLKYELNIYWLFLLTLILRTAFSIWPNVFIQKPVSDMAGKRCQGKSVRMGKSYHGSSEHFPGHSPSSRHWLLWTVTGFLSQSHRLCRNKHIIGEKIRGRKKKEKERCLWEAKLTSISRRSTRWQGSVLAGHYSKQPESLQQSFFSYHHFHHR